MENSTLKNIFLIILLLGIASTKSFSQKPKQLLLKEFIETLVVTEIPFTFINKEHHWKRNQTDSILDKKRYIPLEKKYAQFIPKFNKNLGKKLGQLQCTGNFFLAKKEHFYLILYTWALLNNNDFNFFMLVTINEKGNLISHSSFGNHLIQFNISKHLAIKSSSTRSTRSLSISNKGKFKQTLYAHVLRFNFQ
jgi:hypothetical protein